LNILVIAPYSFPEGMAATNRIIAYAKGLIMNGANVDIIIPFPTDLFKNKILPNEGYFEGIFYKYAVSRYKSKYKILRGISSYTGLRNIWGYIKSFLVIIQLNKKSHYQCVITSTDNLLSLIIYSMTTKFLRCSLIYIYDEYPTPIRHKLKNKIPRWKEYSYAFILRNFSGYISISNELRKYYSTLCQKPTFIMSGIYDASRFIDKAEEKNNKYTQLERYLCYMGNMELSKDDVDNIIKAFALVKKDFPYLVLKLFGCPNVQEKKILQNLISELKIENKVVLMGIVNSIHVPEILSKAFLLVSSQPNTIRAKGGFPTKLCEYLASGIPTILTDVGENNTYIKDNIHAFFVKPNDPIAYANKIREIIENYESSLAIANNGRQFVNQNYSHFIVGKKLLKFIDGIEKK
jgi:glycosyltransferase involved in cell wall biosynthesis